MAAGTAQDRELIEFLSRPNDCVVSSKLGMAFMAREPFAAAFEFDRDNVVRPAIMQTPRFRIDIDADNFDAVNFHALRSRGQTNTRIDPTIQHTIIITNPLLNEPLC